MFFDLLASFFKASYTSNSSLKLTGSSKVRATLEALKLATCIHKLSGKAQLQCKVGDGSKEYLCIQVVHALNQLKYKLEAEDWDWYFFCSGK